jgi:chromosome segregation ATPase
VSASKTDMQEASKLAYDLLEEFNEINKQISESQDFLEIMKEDLHAERTSSKTNVRQRKNTTYLTNLATNIITMMNNISGLISEKAKLKLKINEQYIKLEQMSKDSEENGDNKELINDLIKAISSSKEDIKEIAVGNQDNLDIINEDDLDLDNLEITEEKHESEETETLSDDEKIRQDFKDVILNNKLLGNDFSLAYNEKENGFVYIHTPSFKLYLIDEIWEKDTVEYNVLMKYDEYFKDNCCVVTEENVEIADKNDPELHFPIVNPA